MQDRPALDPFVGRAAELARIAEVVSRAESGQPWLVAIEGDLVAISGCGAYASSLANRYNGRPRPAEVFIHPAGDLELARTREQVS